MNYIFVCTFDNRSLCEAADSLLITGYLNKLRSNSFLIEQQGGFVLFGHFAALTLHETIFNKQLCTSVVILCI